MKTALLWIGMLAVLLIALVVEYHWDSATNRGHAWGYWGQFNNVSNSLARIPGVTIIKSWYNADISLEEFGFDILFQDHPVKLAFGEKDPIRELSRGNLQRPLLALIREQSASNRAEVDAEMHRLIQDDSSRH